MRDEGRPLGIGLQDPVSNHGKRLGHNGPGRERCRKGGTTRQVRIEKANESEPLVMRRKRRNVIETGLQLLVRDKLGGYLSTDQAVTGAKVLRARFRLLCGTWEPSRRCKGKSPSGRPTRRKVPMRRGGADWPVVAMKPGNAGGAKGPTCSVLAIGQPARGRADG